MSSVRIFLAVAALGLIGIPGIVFASCPNITTPYVQFDQATGDFAGMQPTSVGNAIFCGSFGNGTSGHFYFGLQGTNVWWYMEINPVSNSAPIPFVINLGELGNIAFDLDPVSFEPTSVFSTVTDCQAIGTAPELTAAYELFNKYQAFFFAGIGSETALDGYATLANVFGSYVRSTSFIDDCQNYYHTLSDGDCYKNTSGCLPCSSCCTKNYSDQGNACNQKYEAQKKQYGIWQKFKVALGLADSPQMQQRQCLQDAMFAEVICSAQCNAAWCDPPSPPKP